MNLASTLSSLVDLLPTSPISNLTTRKYALPDKAVASQVLMYRQLLHTACKPGLRLSRGYEGTDAQRAVKHMPWWEHGVEQTRRMVISYDNLIVRLWVHGAILPYIKGGYAAEHSKWTLPKDFYDDSLIQSQAPTQSDADADWSKDRNLKEEHGNEDKNEEHIDTLINEHGLPPIPHPYWVDRLGFQQTDPVTDFRSGGVLSLAMLVHMVVRSFTKRYQSRSIWYFKLKCLLFSHMYRTSDGFKRNPAQMYMHDFCLQEMPICYHLVLPVLM